VVSVLGSVRKDTDEPPSLQVYRMLASAISRRAFGPGNRLPSERELSSRVGVSRATLRVALRALHDDGLLEPAHGKGWHVVNPDVVEEEGLEPPLSFTEMAAARGLTSSADVLYQDVRPGTIEEAEELGIAPGSPVFCLDRLRRLDKVPVAIASVCMPAALVEPVADLDYSEQSLYAALRERCGIRPVRSDYVLQAQGASRADAELLELEAGKPVLVGDYKCFDDQDRAFEIGRITYRGDRYRFRTVLRTQR
jgi:DNA-binding GntR family transcriptional regulator